VLTGKNAVIVKSKDKKSYKAYPYDRVYLEFGPSDKLTEVDTQTNGEPTKLPDGSVFKKTVPESAVSTTSATDLLTAAVNICQDDAAGLSEYKDIADAGYLLLLSFASTGRDLWVRSDSQKIYRKDTDPAAAREKRSIQMVAEQKSLGRVITIEQANARQRKAAIADYVDFDGLSVEEATAKVNAEWGIAT
jgi:hypothetical protein